VSKPFPYPGGHIILIAEPEDLVPGEDVWVRCLPPGDIGSWPTRLEAVIKALEHDGEHGGMSGVVMNQ
jgi:hypothetical protein